MLRQIQVAGTDVAVDDKLTFLDAELKRLLNKEATPFDQVVIQVASKLKYNELMRVLGVCTHQTVGLDPKNKLKKLSLLIDQDNNP